MEDYRSCCRYELKQLTGFSGNGFPTGCLVLCALYLERAIISFFMGFVFGDEDSELFLRLVFCFGYLSWLNLTKVLWWMVGGILP